MLTWTLLFLTGYANAEEQSHSDRLDGVTDGRIEMQDGDLSAASCSCEEEIRHCDRLLAEKDQSCAELRRQSARQCEDRLQATTDASTEAHEISVQELTLKLQQQATKDCDEKVSEAYVRGRNEAETRCDEQLTANRKADQQLRTAHQAEVKYWLSIIDKVRERKELDSADCERRVSETGRLYEGKLAATLEANQQCRTAHQAEVEKVTTIVNEMRDEQRSTQVDCERRAEESYNRGWREVEVQYEEQLENTMEAMAQSRATHENEIQRLTTVINQIREQSEEMHTNCERRLTEFHSTGLRQTQAMAQKQIEEVERQLSALRITAQLRIDYLVEEKVRLEREHRDLFQSLSHAQLLLLETQRDLTTARAQSQVRWIPHIHLDGLVELGVRAWESLLAERVKLVWYSFGKGQWDRYVALLCQLAQILRVKFEIHVFLMAGLVADVTKTIYTEIRLFIRDLPETLPMVIEMLGNAMDFVRVEATDLIHSASQYLLGQASALISAAQGKITPVFHKLVEELHLEELEPHIRAMKKKMLFIHKSLSPYFDQLDHSVGTLKKDIFKLLQGIKQSSFEMLNRVYAFATSRMRSLDVRKDEFVKAFGLAARTLFLVLQVYEAPKFVLDLLAHCHQRPEAALLSLTKLCMGLVGLWLVKWVVFPVKRKRLPRRKVKFVLTQ